MCSRVQAQQRESTISSSDREVTEHRITVMLISVVVVFLVCQLPQAIQKLYTVYLVSTPCALTTDRRLRLAIGANFCNLLVIVNSAINFVLYSALSAKFRQTFRRTFCRCRVVAPSRRRGPDDCETAVPLATTVDDARRTRLPRPTVSAYLSPVHTSNNVEATLSNATS